MPSALELLHELLPTATRIAVIVNPAEAIRTETTLHDIEPAARTILASRPIPPVAHGGLIGNPGTLAAVEKADAVIKVPSVKHACRAATFAA